ncbi:hypothetical protein [Chryseobacterium sp. 2987]|uniref:hypothetical protein n=1 Tax=Chryseobacterium sp. 2987 TaxID=2817767 RepID=UPI0028636930|nr:hypothetical protein [Chryseobacterium sp. 2987]MDR6921242.1 hypothetical protein [Chryseobacterium sp. 2987]
MKFPAWVTALEIFSRGFNIKLSTVLASLATAAVPPVRSVSTTMSTIIPMIYP